MLKRKVFRAFVIFMITVVVSGAVFMHAESSIKVIAEEEDFALMLDTPSCILMEATTGEIIFEKNAHEVRPPASITKIMTLLLIFEEIEKGKITLDDIVTVSEHAASMGGSQVFFEPSEEQSVETMIKCIAIASANDACVAMAEHIAGSEAAFVKRMNERAAELGMKDTNFVNCCGLDTDGHVSSAYDVAVMSRILITKFPQISTYSLIWMDEITHTTAKGSTKFGLTNTNKLIKRYNGITGLKTGSTGKAKYCLSATAEKNGLKMIAVIMAAPDTKTRFSEAVELLNYGYANCSIYVDKSENNRNIQTNIKRGKELSVNITMVEDFSYLLKGEESPEKISKEIVIYENITAPVSKGDTLGVVTYYIDEKQIGSVSLVAEVSIEKMTYGDYIKKAFDYLFL